MFQTAFVYGFSIFLCLLYVCIVFGYACRLRGEVYERSPLGKALPILTILTHLLFLLILALRLEQPLLNVFGGGLSALALGITLACYLIEWITREKNLGLWIMSLPMIFQIIATTQIGADIPQATLPRGLVVGMHIISALIGYGALALSAAFSMMYLMQYHQIKSHRLGVIFERLPSLDKLEEIAHRLVHIGLAFLLVGVIVGEWLLFKQEGHLVVTDIKIIMAVIACGVYAVAILLRNYMSIQGKRFAQVSLIGFLLILFSLLIVDQFLPSFHGFSDKNKNETQIEESK